MNNFKTKDLIVRINDASAFSAANNINALQATEMNGGRCPSPSKDKAWENKLKGTAPSKTKDNIAGKDLTALTNLKNAISALQQQKASC